MKISDHDVMRLFDGEIDAGTSRRVAAERVGDPTVDARLAGLLQVAAFTRVWARARQVRAPARAGKRREWMLPLQVGLGGGVLAVAAFVLLPGLGSAEVTAPPARALLPAAAVAVEQVDFGAHAGTIFSVSAAGTETTVVWLSDDTDENSLAL